MEKIRKNRSINRNDIENYQIVVSSDIVPIVERAANRFAEHISELTGVKLPIVSDKTAESDYEILIGTSDRAKSTEYLKKYDLEAANYRDFYTELDGNTLILNAGNAGAGGVAWAIETKVYDIKNAPLKKDAPISRALAATLLYNFAKVFGK